MSGGSEGVNEQNIKEELERMHKELASNQIELDEDAKIALYNNLWELYE